MTSRFGSTARAFLSLVFVAGASSAGCTLVENPDDHFLEVPASMECRDYCTRYLATCESDPFNEYAGETECLSACSGFAPGTDLDYERNTLACRANHLDAAQSIDSATHCPHASASGGSVCVRDTPTACESFCGLYQERCTSNFIALDPDGEGGVSAFFNCVTLCNGTSDSTMPEAGSYTGRKLGCFESYLNLSESNGDDFCAEASPNETELCREDATVCDAFCSVAEERCSEPLAATFVDEDGCQTACAGGDVNSLLAGIDAMASDDQTTMCSPVLGNGGPCSDADRTSCFPNE